MGAPRRPEPITLFDRLAMGFVGVLFGALTLLGYALAASFVAPKTGAAMFVLFASPLGLAYIGLCGLAGALLNPVTLAEVFAVLWFNHPFWETNRGRWTAALVAIALFAGLVMLRTGPTYWP